MNERGVADLVKDLRALRRDYQLQSLTAVVHLANGHPATVTITEHEFAIETLHGGLRVDSEATR